MNYNTSDSSEELWRFNCKSVDFWHTGQHKQVLIAQQLRIYITEKEKEKTLALLLSQRNQNLIETLQ